VFLDHAGQLDRAERIRRTRSLWENRITRTSPGRETSEPAGCVFYSKGCVRQSAFVYIERARIRFRVRDRPANGNNIRELGRYFDSSS